MDIPDAITAYLSYLRDTLSRAEGTVTGNMQEVFRFAEWLEDHDLETTQAVTADLVEQFAKDCYITDPVAAKAAGMRKPHAETTVNQYKGCLRNFLRWLAEEQLLGEDSSPWRKLINQKNPKPLHKKAFTHREDIHHFAAKGRETHPRDEAWIYFQHYMARRMGELQRMRVEALDLDPYPEYPFGLFTYDNTKARQYGIRGQIEPEFAPIAKRWLEDYAAMIGRPLRPTDYLIPALDPGKGWTRVGVKRNVVLVPERPVGRTSVHTLLDRAGIPNSHSLRRGTAVSLIRRHGIRDAKNQLGHASEITTELYADHNRETVELGAKFALEAAQLERRGLSLEAPERPVEASAMDELAARRSRRFRTG